MPQYQLLYGWWYESVKGCILVDKDEIKSNSNQLNGMYRTSPPRPLVKLLGSTLTRLWKYKQKNTNLYKSALQSQTSDYIDWNDFEMYQKLKFIFIFDWTSWFYL